MSFVFRSTYEMANQQGHRSPGKGSFALPAGDLGRLDAPYGRVRAVIPAPKQSAVIGVSVRTAPSSVGRGLPGRTHSPPSFSMDPISDGQAEPWVTPDRRRS